MTDQPKVREAFEAWASSAGYRMFKRVPDDELYMKSRRGHYSDFSLDDAWIAWQAAIAHASSARGEECSVDDHIEGGGNLVDARDAARYRKLFDGPYPFCFEGQTYDTKRDADEAIDQAIAGRRGDGHG